MDKLASIKITLLLLIAILGQNMQAQNHYAWKNMGNGVYGGEGFDSGSRVQKCKYRDGNIYITEHKKYTGHTIIHKWDGRFWSMYPALQTGVGEAITIQDLEEYNGVLYVCGQIDSTKGLKRPGGTLNTLRFDGKKWDTLPSGTGFGNSASITGLKVFNGKLYFTVNSDAPFNASLVSMDAAGKFTVILKVPNAKFNCIEVANKKLVVGGSIDSINGNKSSGMFYFDGANFSYTKTKGIRNIHSIWVKNDFQYLVVDRFSDKLEYWETDSMKQVIPKWYLPGGSWLNYTFAFVHEIILTRGINGYMTITNDYWLDSSKYKQPGILYPGPIMLSAPGKAFMIMLPTHAYRPSPLELVSASYVQGKVFEDMDTNCTYGPNDKPMRNVLVELRNESGSYITSSNKDGIFSAPVFEGTYEILSHTPMIMSSVAPCKVGKVTIGVDDLIKGVEIPIHTSKARNLAVTFNAYRGYITRQGFKEKYVLTGINYGYRSDSIVIRLKYPDKATLVSSDVKPYSQTAHELVYKFDNLNFLEQRKVNLVFSTAVKTSKIGDLLEFSSIIENSETDTVIENNEDTLVQKVVAAFDPNLKQCYPQGKVKPGLKKIKYQIHFQNTGKDTAYKVTVIDTITQKLGLRSIRVTGTSHPASYSLRVDNNQALVWEFENILLPDSHTNEGESHGFIAFEADINGLVAIGDSISNKAYIYFDYQEPVKTNTASIVVSVHNTDVQSGNISTHGTLKLYPNPATSLVNVEVDKQYEHQNLLVFNSLGQLVCTAKAEEGTAVLHLAGLPGGMYFVKIEGTQVAGLLMLE